MDTGEAVALGLGGLVLVAGLGYVAMTVAEGNAQAKRLQLEKQLEARAPPAQRPQPQSGGVGGFLLNNGPAILSLAGNLTNFVK